MEISKLAARVPIYPLFIAASLLVGWFMPDFYAWTDSDQSRPSPLLWNLPMWSAIASLVFCLALPWLPIAPRKLDDLQRTPMRFSVRALLLLTAGVAIAIPMLAKFPIVLSGIVCIGAFAYLAAFGARHPEHRMAAVTLVACMALPYSWMVGDEDIGNVLFGLMIMLVEMPAFLPTALLSIPLEQYVFDMQWLAVSLNALEIIIGIWIIRLGPKRTIAYLLLVIHMSAGGSLAFYAMCVA